MDIKTLFRNLREEVSCPECTNIYTDPKQLPCLHSFCLQCLKQYRTNRMFIRPDTVRCPKCQTISEVPKSGDMKDFPTSFHLNTLIDVLAIRECTISPVKCGNCDKSCPESSYCFQCVAFYCQECLVAHNMWKSYREHRVLALKDFQGKDYEDVMRRPAFCRKEDHSNKELEYFCKRCEIPACQLCVIVDHGGHNKESIKKEAGRQKSEMKSLIEKQRRNLQAKMEAVNRLDEEIAKLTQKGEDTKRNVQTFVDELIAIIEAKKEKILSSVEKETSKSLEPATKRKIEIQRQIEVIRSSLETADKLLNRSTNAEVVQIKPKSICAIFKEVDQNEPIDHDTKSLPANFIFEKNQMLLDTVKTEKIGTYQDMQFIRANQSIAEGKGLEEGTVNCKAKFTLTTRNAHGDQCYNERDHVTVEIQNERRWECATDVRINDCKDGVYQISFTPEEQGRYEVTVKVNGEHVRREPFTVLVKSFQLKPVLSFGEKGSAVGMLKNPMGVAVNSKDEIAVTDWSNHRIQIFDSHGTYIRSFGRKGNKAGEFDYPQGIVFHNNGNIFVADSCNNRIQIFSGEGNYVGNFGSFGGFEDELKNPWGLSVDSDGNIIVADKENSLIKIFSPNGNFLMEIGGLGSLKSPRHCIQHDKYLIVSDSGEHCIKVFDRNGNFLYKFGKKGTGDGEFDKPCFMTMDKSGHLMVSDQCNHRVQVFEPNGKFIGKFGGNGGNLGEFKNPVSLAILSNYQIVVCEWNNHRIQIFE